MDYNNIIQSIEAKFSKVDTELSKLIKKSSTNQTLFTKLDIINALGITNQEYNLLQDYLDYPELTNVQVQKLIEINQILTNQLKYIDLVNDNLILKNPKVATKNTIQYLLNKKNSSDNKNNIVINIDFTDGEKVKLKDILKKEEE